MSPGLITKHVCFKEVAGRYLTSVLSLPMKFCFDQDLCLALLQVDCAALTVLLPTAFLSLMTNDTTSWEEGTNWRNFGPCKIASSGWNFSTIAFNIGVILGNCHIHCSILLLRDTYEKVIHTYKGFFFFPWHQICGDFITPVLWFSDTN